MKHAVLRSLFPLAAAVVIAGCPAPTEPDPDPVPAACDDDAEVMTTADGVAFVRTPDACFEDLVDWPYAPRYVEIDGLRQAYVDEGPSDGPVVLLLHGQPSWSYLYRKMIPVLVGAGYRVIAMDHVGMGRSDKPTEIGSYTYLGHVDRLERFIEALELRDIRLFAQDWGSLIGLRVAGLHPGWFSHIAIGNGTLPVMPAGASAFPPVDDPDTIVEMESPFAASPDQQVPLYDGCELLLSEEPYFGNWMAYAMTASTFRASEVLEAMTWFALSDDEEAAYDAPYPSRTYMAGARSFPSLANELPGLNEDAWAGLTSYTRPFLTLWASNDPGNLGRCETQAHLVTSIPGAAGQPHDRLDEASHFLQDDQGEEIARRLVDFYVSEPVPPAETGRGYRFCEVLLLEQVEGGIEAEIWGTQGIGSCPDEAVASLDPEAIAEATGSLGVMINGPRRGVMDESTGFPAPIDRRTFGDLEMRFLAVLEVDPTSTGMPYAEVAVRRSTTFTFDAGLPIFELTSPEGVVYVMQSMSMEVDASLTLEDLPTLDARLVLPEGWTFASRVLDAPLELTVDGTAYVLQDDLRNSYQRVTSPDAPPVAEDGTGTACTDHVDCEGLEASFCLQGPTGGACTVSPCEADACVDGFACCEACDEAVAAMLPFDDATCVPEEVAAQLAAGAGCTCN
jgi:haloalkane dehalogenase